jgi:hypothetical protein
MKHSEFRVGKSFWCGGRLWRCTDIGSRVVVAILLDSFFTEQEVLKGPPYSVAEMVFDEDDLLACKPEKK